MRALFLASHIYSVDGGLERFNRRFVRALVELRREGVVGPIVTIAWSDTEVDRAAVPEGVRHLVGDRSRIRTGLRFLWEVLRRRPRVIFYGYVGFAALAPLARILNPGAVHLMIVHGVEVWRKPPPLRRWATRHGLDAILSVSEFTVRQMSAYFRLSTDLFRVFPNCLDTDGLSRGTAADRSAGPLEGRHKLISVTRLSLIDDYKNVDKVILALPRVLAKFPDTHYYVVGDGPWRPDLERLSSSTGVSGNVHFLGRMDDADRDAVYADSDIFVLPSTGEGFGIVFLEAWSFGLPCVASNRDAAQEVIRHGVDGYCVDPRPEAIAESICSLLADPEKRRAMGASGRRRLESNYTHEQFRENLKRVLRELA